MLAGCVGPGVPRSALRDVLRLATPVVLAALPIDQANDPNQRQLPTGDGLARACLDVELLAFEHAPTFARNRSNHFAAEARVKFWDGPASTTIPLRYQLRDATTGPTAPLAGGTSATGSYEDTVTPAALGTRHYELTVDLDSGGNDAVLASFFDRQTDVVEVRERLELQARRPSDVAFADSVGAVGPGGTVLLRIRLAGDDIAGKTITVAHDENGSVAPTTTSDANGEAFLSYGAPAIAQIELVTATITEGGMQSGDAVVITTVAPPAAGVTRIRNRAAVAAACLDAPALDNLVSAPGVSTFDESLPCAGTEGAHSLRRELLPRDVGRREGHRGRAAGAGGRRAGYAPRRVRDGGGQVRDRVHCRPASANHHCRDAQRVQRCGDGRTAPRVLRHRRRRSPHVRESRVHGRPQPRPLRLHDRDRRRNVRRQRTADRDVRVRRPGVVLVMRRLSLLAAVVLGRSPRPRRATPPTSQRARSRSAPSAPRCRSAASS